MLSVQASRQTDPLLALLADRDADTRKLYAEYLRLGYYGDMGDAPDAKTALILSLVGLFCFGFILGPIAILKARSALQMIRMNPGMRGEGLAIAGMVIGIVDIF